MATRINSKPQSILLSSSIGVVSIYTEKRSVYIEVRDQYGMTILSGRYYAHGSDVELYDFSTLFELEMRNNHSSYTHFTLNVYEETGNNRTLADSCRFDVLFCDRFALSSDASIFVAENFLTSLDIRRIPDKTSQTIFVFVQKGESLEYRIAASFRDSVSGVSHTVRVTTNVGKTASDTKVHQMDISFNTVSSLSSNLSTYVGFIPARAKLVSFTITMGKRSVTFFIDKSLRAEDHFIFRNCFDVWESAYFHAETTAKTNVNSSLAILGSESKLYDFSVNKTYEVETGPLNSDEAEWIDQLCSSHEIMRIETDSTIGEQLFVHAIITESTCEISDTDEKLQTVKFTWRYVDNRPHVRMSTSPGIFTEQYTYPFS